MWTWNCHCRGHTFAYNIYRYQIALASRPSTTKTNTHNNQIVKLYQFTAYQLCDSVVVVFFFNSKTFLFNFIVNVVEFFSLLMHVWFEFKLWFQRRKKLKWKEKANKRILKTEHFMWMHRVHNARGMHTPHTTFPFPSDMYIYSFIHSSNVFIFCLECSFEIIQIENWIFALQFWKRNFIGVWMQKARSNGVFVFVGDGQFFWYRKHLIYLPSYSRDYVSTSCTADKSKQ